MSQQILNGASAAFAFCATLFLMIGCVGHSNEESAVKDTNWINVDQDGVKIWFGLQKAFFNGGSFNYDSNSCTSDFCDRCNTDGQSAIALLVISTIFAAVSTGIAGFLIVSPSGPIQLANFGVAFTSGFFALIGFSVFMGDCYNKIDQDVDQDLEFGPGSILALLGLLMMLIVSIMQFAAVMVGSAGDGTPKPAAPSTNV